MYFLFHVIRRIQSKLVEGIVVLKKDTFLSLILSNMNSSVDLTILPCEVRHYIWSYCSKPSLKVLSLCCKQFYAEVKPLVWKRVEVSWESLEGMTKKLIEKPNLNLQSISCLVLDARSRNMPSIIRNLSWGYLTFGLGSFLQRCDRLKSLTISRFLAADGPRLVSEFRPQLENLEMTDMKFGAGDLKPLVGLHQLKSLTLDHCKFQKSDWDVVWQLQSLEHLKLVDGPPPDFDDFIPHSGFHLKHLLSLELFYTGESHELYSCIAKTIVKLESLNLTVSIIQY